jgi:hypothetical protein
MYNYFEFMQSESARMTYKSAASDEYILGVRKETCARNLSLQIINNKGREKMA